jgi:O-acetyl-ADP-ribose deacetylase (regulator of RNase III)
VGVAAAGTFWAASSGDRLSVKTSDRRLAGLIVLWIRSRHSALDDEGQAVMNVLRALLQGRVLIKVGDITREDVDAIVNAANSTLMGGGGVDGAIHRAGGPAILLACKEIRRQQFPHGLPTGQAVITTAGEMTAKHVIHTVGPVYGSGGAEKAELLAACYFNSLGLAVAHGLKSIAFPAISTGVYGYPLTEAAAVSSRTIEQFLLADKTIEEVRLVFFSAGNAKVFLKHHAFKE